MDEAVFLTTDAGNVLKYDPEADVYTVIDALRASPQSNHNLFSVYAQNRVVVAQTDAT